MKLFLTLCCFLQLSIFAFAQKPKEAGVKLLQPEYFNEFPNVRDLAISPDKNDIYFTVESLKKEFAFIAHVRVKKGKWGKPEVAVFSGKHKDLEPAFSPDGLKLFFASNRPENATDTVSKKDFDIWYVERTTLQAAWSEPKNCGKTINTSGDEFYPSVARSGNLYFTAQRPGSKGKEDIFVSVFQNGIYQVPQSLSDSINSEKYEFNAFVSPKEDLLLFTSFGRNDDLGGGDLYFSTKNNEGEWLKAKNVGASVNSSKIDYCPFVDLNDQFLYFTSERSSVRKSYGKKKNLKAILENINQFANGSGQLYFILLKDTNLPASVYKK